MEITDKDGMTHEVASNNKGNAALTLGIIGAAGVGLDDGDNPYQNSKVWGYFNS